MSVGQNIPRWYFPAQKVIEFYTQPKNLLQKREIDENGIKCYELPVA